MTLSSKGLHPQDSSLIFSLTKASLLSRKVDSYEKIQKPIKINKKKRKLSPKGAILGWNYHIISWNKIYSNRLASSVSPTTWMNIAVMDKEVHFRRKKWQWDLEDDDMMITHAPLNPQLNPHQHTRHRAQPRVVLFQ